MDRITKLTEQLRLRQPNMAEADFLTLEDYNGLNGSIDPSRANDDDDEPETESLGDLNIQPRNDPPKDGFSNAYVELEDRQIDVNFLRKLDCVVSERRLKPISSLQEVALVFALKNHLMRRKLTVPTTCQSFMWPALVRGSSVCCIGPPRTGKTVGYLLPLISSSISFVDEQEGNSDIFLPYSLLLCPTGKSVRKVATEAVKLIPTKGSYKPYIKVVCCDSPSVFKNKKTQADLLNGYNLLVTTPSLFLRLVELKLVSINNCRTLVFDEADELFLLHPEASQKLHTLYIKNYRRERSSSALESISERAEDFLNAQVIVCSESYSYQVRHVVEQFIKRPVNIMSDKVEAAIRARIECHVEFCDNAKDSTLLGILAKFDWLDKTIICCRDHQESKALKELIGDQIHCEILSTESKHFNFPHLKSMWRSKGRIVVIVDDDVLLSAIATIQIDDARCLIHYSIPESKGTFASRFIFMQSWLKSPEKGRCVTAIIVDPSNRKQAHELVLLIKQLGAPVPEGLIALRNSFPRGLCQSFAAFGHCPLKNLNCHFDHFCSTFSNVEIKKPRVGHQVKFIVTSVRSANSFYARITHYRGSENVDGSWTSTQHSQEFILKQLQGVNLEGSLSKKEIALGQLCATHHVVNGEQQVHRVRVEEFRDSSEENYVKVFHIDHGFETVVQFGNLMPLPSEWSGYPPFAVKCYVLKFKPNFNEPHWDQQASQIILEALRKPEVSFVTGWVSNVYNSCYWIEDVDVYHQLPSLKTDLKAYKLMDLISKTDLFSEAKRPHFATDISAIVCDTRTKWKVERQSKIAAKAFIQDPGDEFHLVRCDEDVERNVFIRHVKFEKLLTNLETELAAAKKNPVKTFCKGLICACEFDNTVSRVIVRKVKDEESVDVFFPDHGELYEVDKKSCFEIDDKYISQLPFQAIAVHIPLDEAPWNEDQVYDLTRNTGDVFKKLQVEKLTSDPIPHVRIFVPIKESETTITFEDLVHLIQKGDAVLSDRSFDVEKVVTEKDSSDIEDEMSPEEMEAQRAFLEIFEEGLKKFAAPFMLPDGGQKPTQSSQLPEPVLNGVAEDEEREKQVIPVDGDVTAFDYDIPAGVPALPYDDIDNDEEVESDDDIELRGNDGNDDFFEAYD